MPASGQESVQPPAPRDARPGRHAPLGRAVVWSSSNGSVAAVTSEGIVTTRVPGTAAITAASEGKSAAARVVVLPPIASLTFDQPPQTLRVGQSAQLGVTLKDSTVRVATDLCFVALAAGSGDTCGLTLQGTAYCWGFNSSGQVGDGTTSNRSSPTKVLGQP